MFSSRIPSLVKTLTRGLRMNNDGMTMTLGTLGRVGLVQNVQNRLISRSLIRHQSAEGNKKEGEDKIIGILKRTFPAAKDIQVEDISGGCGSMYAIFVESTDFEGLSKVKQHQLVTNALKAEIKEMHGLRIQTSLPK